MLFKVFKDVCSIGVFFPKKHGDPYYEPTIVVHDSHIQYCVLPSNLHLKIIHVEKELTMIANEYNCGY